MTIYRSSDLLRVSIKGSDLRMSKCSILNREGLLSSAPTFFSGEVVANSDASTEMESGGDHIKDPAEIYTTLPVSSKPPSCKIQLERRVIRKNSPAAWQAGTIENFVEQGSSS